MWNTWFYTYEISKCVTWEYDFINPLRRNLSTIVTYFISKWDRYFHCNIIWLQRLATWCQPALRHSMNIHIGLRIWKRDIVQMNASICHNQVPSEVCNNVFRLSSNTIKYFMSNKSNGVSDFTKYTYVVLECYLNLCCHIWLLCQLLHLLAHPQIPINARVINVWNHMFCVEINLARNIFGQWWVL